MILRTEDGVEIRPGQTVHAVRGAYKGRRFRFVEIHDDGERIHVTLLHPHPFRHARQVLHPSAFGLHIHQPLSRAQHVLNGLHHTWQRIDEWLLAGLVALLPLAFFEHFHWAETITQWLGFGGH